MYLLLVKTRFLNQFGTYSNKSNKYEGKFFKKILTKGIRDKSGKQVTDKKQKLAIAISELKRGTSRLK
jgi:hypothetical protein